MSGKLVDQKLNYFHEGKTAFLEKRYANALTIFSTFWDKERDSCLAAVRNSSVLAEWSDLAKVYPAAKMELLKRRNEVSNQFLDNHKDSQLYRDLIALNRALGDFQHSLLLFEKLKADHKPLAKEYWPYFQGEALENDEFELVREMGINVDKDLEILRKIYKNINQKFMDWPEDEIIEYKRVNLDFTKESLDKLQYWCELYEAPQEKSKVEAIRRELGLSM